MNSKNPVLMLLRQMTIQMHYLRNNTPYRKSDLLYINFSALQITNRYQLNYTNLQFLEQFLILLPYTPKNRLTQ